MGFLAPDIPDLSPPRRRGRRRGAVSAGAASAGPRSPLPGGSSITAIMGPVRTPGTSEYKQARGFTAPQVDIAVRARRLGLPMPFSTQPGGKVLAAPYLTKALDSYNMPIPGLTDDQARLVPYALDAAAKTGVPASLLLAVSGQESGFGTNLGPSSAGARGEMQFIPSTRQSMIQKYKVDPWAGPGQAMKAGALYLKELGVLEDPQRALSSYSGGYAQGAYNNPILQSAQQFRQVDAVAKRRQKAGQLLGALGLAGPAGKGPGGAKVPQAVRPARPEGVWIGPKSPFQFASHLTPEQRAITPLARKMAKKIAGISGQPVNIISGNRPGSITTSGNISDHSSGNGIDIEAYDLADPSGTPQTKKQGDQVAMAAMIAAGIKPKEARQYVAGDGPVEVNTYHNGERVQILWRTDTGGNHHNHVHVGIRPEDGTGTSAVYGGQLTSSGGSYGTGTGSGAAASPADQRGSIQTVPLAAPITAAPLFPQFYEEPQVGSVAAAPEASVENLFDILGTPPKVPSRPQLAGVPGGTRRRRQGYATLFGG